ncbi:malectin domain-containing carbohydrate-binding protein [Umezawaea beigongshangensis]|uniref:malectin domain-containing carbohydrate-binding protein n=1 Tax=Umezawaea beigongshangensis TaxID=2780383 RepID=UPI0018F11860|nr:malectin domain-containing carbohydrate-binding protein [Umezawaea beigongshangensis]
MRSTTFSRRTAGVLAAVALVSGTASAGVAHADPSAVHVDVGGSGDATFAADSFGTGGIVDTKPAGVRSYPNWGRSVPHPIPAEIWHTSRFTDSSYTVTGLTGGTTYEVRLYFMDWYFQRTGKRVFSVVINGVEVLTNFDITGTVVALGADGQQSFGLERDFPVVVDSTGTVTIDFVRGSADQPQINAISLVPIG